MKRHSRWLILLPAIVLTFFPVKAEATAEPGLVAVGYVVDEIPPIQSDELYPTCGSEIENNINRSFDGEPFQDCPDDMFMVHYSGFITIPEHETVEFWLASDDGGVIDIGGNEFGVWQDQGCSATTSGNLQLEAGSHPLSFFFYENGGGTCAMLAWKIDDNEWEIVPDEAFTQDGLVPATTTSAPTTTSMPEVQTTLEPSTTQASTTSTVVQTTTTSTVVQTTTTTEAPSPPPAQPPATVPPPPTTMQAPPDTAPIPEEPILPEPTAPEPPPTVEEPAVNIPFPEPPDEPPAPETLPIPEPAPTPPDTEPAPPAPADKAEPPLTEAEFDAIVEQLSDATDEQIVALIDEVITKDLNTSQAATFVSSPDVLAAITTDQAEQLFAEIAPEELTVEEAEAVVAAVQDAPSGIRKAFESVLNIFSGFADNYVPFDSRIPVSQRRALIALGAVLLASSPAPTLRRRQ